MTKTQVASLKRLCGANKHEEYVHMSTAECLNSYGYVEILNGTKTQGGSFPHLRCKLTDSGIQYCLIRFSRT